MNCYEKCNPIITDDFAKGGVKVFLTKILCGIEEISQSNQSKFHVTKSIIVKDSCPPSLARSSLENLEEIRWFEKMCCIPSESTFFLHVFVLGGTLCYSLFMP